MIYNKATTQNIALQTTAEMMFDLSAGEQRELLRLISVYEGAMKTVGTMLEVLDAEFRTMHDHNPIHHMESRVKTIPSLYEKLLRKGLAPTLENIREQITDVVGLRIVCPYIRDIYSLTELLCQQDNILVVRKTDYIQTPKRNGYRSMHLVVRVPVMLSDRVEQVPVEIQLRTIAMDMWASLEHELHYKSSQQPVEHLSDRLRRCAVSLADIDLRMQEIYEHLHGGAAEGEGDVLESDADVAARA